MARRIFNSLASTGCHRLNSGDKAYWKCFDLKVYFVDLIFEVMTVACLKFSNNNNWWGWFKDKSSRWYFYLLQMVQMDNLSLLIIARSRQCIFPYMLCLHRCKSTSAWVELPLQALYASGQRNQRCQSLKWTFQSNSWNSGLYTSSKRMQGNFD